MVDIAQSIIKTAGFEKIYEVSGFKKEFSKFSGEKAGNGDDIDSGRYNKWLIARLTHWDEFGIESLKTKHFEVLKVDPIINGNQKYKLYSMRYPHAEKNIRVIFTIVTSDKILLLLTFIEKSKSDYDLAISRAKTIINAL